MESKDKNMCKKSRKLSISNVLYFAASLIAILGIALLVDNILIFTRDVNQYVTQGYPVATVTSELIPSQLLPGVFEPIALYGGIALALLGIGIINKKVSKYLTLLTEVDTSSNSIEESNLQIDVTDGENKEINEFIENVDEIK